MTIAVRSPRAGGHAAPSRAAGGVRGDFSAALIVLAAVPLAFLQIPDLIAAAEPTMLASVASGSRYGNAVIRAAGLALPAMLLAAPAAALGARRGPGWRVLTAGLITLGAADLAASLPATWVETVPGIALDRAVHGLGAGAVLAASLAVVWERRAAARRVLACLWSVAAVSTMTAAVPLIGFRVAVGGWRAALQPYPWLAGVALAVTAVHVVVTGGAGATGSGGRRAGGRATGSGGRGAGGRGGRRDGVTGGAGGVITPAERAQLALLFVPAVGLGALAVGSTFQWPPSGQLAAGGVATAMLTTLAIVLYRDAVVGSVPALPFCALLTGLAMAPSAGVIEGSRLLRTGAAAAPNPARVLLGVPATHAMTAVGAVPALPIAAAFAGGIIAAAVAAGAARSALRPRSDGRRHVPAPNAAAAVGLAVSACGLALARATGTLTRATGTLTRATGTLTRGAGTLTPAQLQTLALALLAGGLALALGAAMADASACAALTVLPLALAGMVTGYLVAGGMQILFVTAGSRGHRLTAAPPAVSGALLRATAMWELAAAATAGLAAIMVLLAGRARRAGVGSPSSG